MLHMLDMLHGEGEGKSGTVDCKSLDTSTSASKVTWTNQIYADIIACKSDWSVMEKMDLEKNGPLVQFFSGKNDPGGHFFLNNVDLSRKK